MRFDVKRQGYFIKNLLYKDIGNAHLLLSIPFGTTSFTEFPLFSDFMDLQVASGKPEESTVVQAYIK